MAKDTETKSSKKRKRQVPEAVAKVKATFNNTVITITDTQGNKVVSGTAGTEFRGSRKGTPFAATAATKKVGEIALKEFGVRKLKIQVKGPGPGREAAIKALADVRDGGIGFTITMIEDVTAIPHNGCRQRKARKG